jgi:hypothetical protein
MRLQFLDIIQTLSHSLHNLVDIFAVLQASSEPSPKALLNNRSRSTDTYHAPERPEQIGASSSDCLVAWIRVCNDIHKRSSDDLNSISTASRPVSLVKIFFFFFVSEVSTGV